MRSKSGFRKLIARLSASVFSLTAACSLHAASNPIIFADFSDPDVARKGDTYYMVASSFNHMPGVPVLESHDLVHWKRVGHVMQNHPEQERFSVPQHGNGIWAPCIRYHDGKFWVFMPDPDHGIYVSTATDPTGEWSEPHLLLPGAGIIDPTPLWDDDGNAWLLHAWAKSRAGFNNVLTLHRMSTDARQILDEGKIIIDGNRLPGYKTLEGPKFYKRDGYYYVFAPAGGVTEGWQTVFRSRDIYGPYQQRVTLEQGMTEINGPHQGAWVTDPEGRDWFFHFQDRFAFGRIVHLQSMRWESDWPFMGKDLDGNGVGEPETTLPLPDVSQPIAGLTASDEFDNTELGLQWQWNANWRPDWYSLKDVPGELRLFAKKKPELNLWQQPALLTQMLYGPTMAVETKLSLHAKDTAETGLLVYGYDYAWLGIRREDERVVLVYETCLDTLKDCQPTSQTLQVLDNNAIELKVAIDNEAQARFAWRPVNADKWRNLTVPEFTAKQGRWVGARVGIFAQAPKGDSQSYADVDYFRVRVE